MSRFFGSTNREAMRQVRLALGPDALIISNRRVNGGVEIIATDATALPPGIDQSMLQSGVDPWAQPEAQGTGPGVPGVSGYPGSTGVASVPASPGSATYPGSSVHPVSADRSPATQPPQRTLHRSPASAYANVAASREQDPRFGGVPDPGASPASSSGSAFSRALDSALPGWNQSPGVPAAVPPSAPSASFFAESDTASANPVEVMSAIGELRGALETRIDELMWSNQLRRVPQAVSLFQSLLGFGFSTALLRALLKRLPEHLSPKAAFQWARSELIRNLPVLDNEATMWSPGQVIALVGPTGVGKTTTIAKLAARCVRRTGPESLVLITTDTYRIGAHEQLKIYGQMLRVPVHVVQNALELRQVVASVRPDQTILIDNIGISQRDRYVTEQAAMLAAAGRAVYRLLVLNASSQGDTLDEVARNYLHDGGTPIRGSIITKIDEASRPGAVLDTVIRYKLPIHYVSNGQKVPENLVFPSAEDLIDAALVQSAQSKALYAPSEADFAALMAMSQTPAEQKAAQLDVRRHQLLPGLLSMLGDTGIALSPDDLLRAAAFTDEQVAVRQAMALWQSLTGPQAVLLASREITVPIRQLLKAAQAEFVQSGSSVMLAVHDQVGVLGATGEKGRLRGTLLASDTGEPWVTPLQQCGFSDGWLSSCGAAFETTPPLNELIAHQVNWLNGQSLQAPLVHVFDGGTPQLWRQLHVRGIHWLIQVPASTRVFVDGSATFLTPVIKQMAHHPLHHLPVTAASEFLAGEPAANVIVWAGEQSVQLQARQQHDLTVRVVSLRVVNRADGTVVKTLFGLTNRPVEQAPLETVASWLLARNELKSVMRHVARAYESFAQTAPDAPRLMHVLASVQCALAAWVLQQGVGVGVARQVAEALVGKPGLPSTSVVPALFKLFALKEMLAHD